MPMHITDRQRQVLSLIVNGLSNKEIADRLGIKHRTVDKHRENIKERLGVRKATDLVRVALQNPFLLGNNELANE